MAKESKPNFVLKFQGVGIPIHLKNATTDEAGMGGGVLICEQDHSQFKQLYRCVEGHEKTIGQIPLRNYEGIIYDAKEKKDYLNSKTAQEVIVEAQEPIAMTDFVAKFIEYVGTEKYEIYDNGLNHDTIEELSQFVRGKFYKAVFGYRGQERPAVLTSTDSRVLVIPLLDFRQIKEINQRGKADRTAELQDFANSKKIQKEEEYYMMKKDNKPIEIQTIEQVVEERRVKLNFSTMK